jgi:hypothetical protein
MNLLPMPKQNYINQLYHLAKLKRQQWLKEDDHIKIQEKKLIVLINHAYHNVPSIYLIGCCSSKSNVETLGIMSGKLCKMHK